MTTGPNSQTQPSKDGENVQAETIANPPSAFVEGFARDGYQVVRGLADPGHCRALCAEVDRSLDPPLGPLEYEAELGYPGAPRDLTAAGGLTPRRLLHAYSRGSSFRDWARSPAVIGRIRSLMGGHAIALVQAHHNCIMTKYPQFGSETGWHQDIRYWHFQRPDLINVWLALGRECGENGGMRVVPGSHRPDYHRHQFDDALFFRTDLDENRPLLDQAIDMELASGDVLFFHCRLLHAADRNESTGLKRSLVYTYNRTDNAPVNGSRSARLMQIPL